MNKKLKLLIWILLPCLLLGSCNFQEKGNFSIGNKTFLLNGEPFVIKAAEIHYTRIPRDYWEHRIKMCKAMGMNTICIYVFWNIHEQQEGVFDFTGQNDIAAFCKLAQKHGMYIMVRPGPYVCSEWEMGGLPWWLLKKKDIALRSNDPYFIERTRIFMNEVGKQLADMQITRGGNIIMVQVENEYSSYATDKAYIANIRDIVKKAGFNEVPLFQCDWSSNFTNNALDDLLWTVNFGVGSNIPQQFEKLRELRPNTPLMCSEYWSGWFDHWGRPHETRNSDALIKGMKEMLDDSISFSLYMAHGGTTFGHWGGANCPPFSAMCSSYDYDAPISEAGWITPKYHAVRELLASYLPQGEKLPEIPDSIPVIEIPSFKLNLVAPLFDNLPEAKQSEQIKPMEQFDQGWGTILYRTKLPASASGKKLVITEPHDWTQIFIDGEKRGVMDRRRNETSIVLPSVKEGAVLDILVEAMGRVNFDKAIHDRKGITEKVELISEQGEATELTGWEVFNFPVVPDVIPNDRFVNSEKSDKPAYYKGTFPIEKPGDVFLDMSSWGKGLVWVNGHAIGRFWKIGPQQTLYMPGCWLKKGENEIVVLDLAGPEKAEITGLKQPILDLLRPDRSLLHREEGQTLDLTGEKPTFTGSMKPGNGWQQIKFGKTVPARYFCLELLSSQQPNDPNSAIAELYVRDEAGKRLSRQNWKIVYADSEEVSAASNGADKVFDLQESTFWHTEYRNNNPAHPHYLIIDLGEEVSVSGFDYLPRAEKDLPGMVKDYQVYLKTNSFNIK